LSAAKRVNQRVLRHEESSQRKRLLADSVREGIMRAIREEDQQVGGKRG
jgi:hypothetical protein